LCRAYSSIMWTRVHRRLGASPLGQVRGVSRSRPPSASASAGGALADDPGRGRAAAAGGYTSTAVLSSLVGAATAPWQVGPLRAGAWASRGLRVPSRNALLAGVVVAGLLWTVVSPIVAFAYLAGWMSLALVVLGRQWKHTPPAAGA
jgi:hypothetical protein